MGFSCSSSLPCLVWSHVTCDVTQTSFFIFATRWFRGHHLVFNVKDRFTPTCECVLEKCCAALACETALCLHFSSFFSFCFKRIFAVFSDSFRCVCTCMLTGSWCDTWCDTGVTISAVWQGFRLRRKLELCCFHPPILAFRVGFTRPPVLYPTLY